MAYSIRPATTADLFELNQLVNSAYRGESSRAGWTTEADYLDGQRTDEAMLARDIEDPAQKTILLLHEGAAELLACVYLERLADAKCYLGMLTVRPTLQAKGIGQALLKASEEFAVREWGARRMRLRVVHGRESLIAWYERRGYLKTGETNPFPYENPAMGLPKVLGLYFHVFEKELG